jgi:hypothetical protein
MKRFQINNYFFVWEMNFFAEILYILGGKRFMKNSCDTIPLKQKKECLFTLLVPKIRNGPNGVLRGLVETDLWKKT